MNYLLRMGLDFWRDPWQVRYAAPLVVINILGSFYGYYWYHDQLAANPFYFWPFIPDSPLATTLFALALALRRQGAGWLLFRVVSCTASIKYGIWAMVMISHYWSKGGPLELVEMMLWLSHLGMAVQGAIYLRDLRPGSRVILLTGAWLVLNDLMDYVLGLHPYLFTAGQESLALLTAAALTALLAGGLVLRGALPNF